MIPIPESESIPEWFHFWLDSASEIPIQSFRVSLESESRHSRNPASPPTIDFLVCSLHRLCCIVGVIPKEGLAGTTCQSIFLAWKLQRSLKTHFCGMPLFDRIKTRLIWRGCNYFQFRFLRHSIHEDTHDVHTFFRASKLDHVCFWHTNVLSCTLGKPWKAIFLLSFLVNFLRNLSFYYGTS